MSATLDKLNQIRRIIEEAWPDDCCEKGVMKENTGKETVACLSSCAWNTLYRDLVIVMVDVEIKESRAAVNLNPSKG